MVKRVKNEELKLALERNAILLAELAKIKEPVKSRRKQNKKQVELDVNQFISKTKPKDQLTERLQGARIKLALDNQYNKLISEAQGKRKADIGKVATESQEVKLDKAHIEGKKQEKLLLLKAKEDEKLLLLKENEDAKQDAKDARNNLLMEKLQRIEDKRLLIEENRDAKQDARDKQMLKLLKDDNKPNFQTPMMATPMIARGRPPGSMGKSNVVLNDGTIDTTLDNEGIVSLRAIAKAEGVHIKGLTKKDDIKKAILDRSLNYTEVKPQRLFATIEEEVNEPRQNPYYSNLPVDEDESTRTKNFIDKSAPPRSEKSVVMQNELEDKKGKLELLQQKRAKRQNDVVIPPPTTPITPSVAKVKLSRVDYDKVVEQIDAIKDKKTILDTVNQLGIEIPEELQKELKAPKQGNKHSNQLKKLLKNHYEPEDASSTEKFERKLTKREQLLYNEGLNVEEMKRLLDKKGIPYNNEKEKALRILLNNTYKK